MKDRDFVGWLLGQHKRKDAVGDLARTLKADPMASRMQSARDLSQRLNQDEAGWQYHEALEEAEAEWCQLAFS